MSFWERLWGKQPAVHVYLYTKDGVTIRGSLLAIHGARYELGACSVAPEGSDTFKAVMGRVVVPVGNVSWYTIRD